MSRLLLPLVLLSACASPRVAQDAPLQAAPSLHAAFERMPSPAHARLRLVPDNVDAWVTRWRMLEAAQRSIDVQYFIITPDAFGLALLGLLCEKREAGVDVRLMVDSRGTPSLTRAHVGLQLLDTLAGVGAEVRVYNTVENEMFKGDIRKVIASNHDKLLIVDGHTAILGGRNISVEYMVDPRDMPDAFIDLDIVVDGQAAAVALTKAFTVELGSTHARAIEADRGVAEREVLAVAVAAMRAWLTGAELTAREQGRLRPQEAQASAAQALADQALATLAHEPAGAARRALDDITAQLVALPHLRGALSKAEKAVDTRDAAVRVLDTQSIIAAPMRDRVSENLLIAVAAARHEVVLQSPYLVLSERGIDTLADAAKRGVRIVLFTNSPTAAEGEITQAAFLKQWPQILARVPTARLFVRGVPGLMHAKSAIIDGQLAFVGSYNLDPISAHVNGEVVVVAWSKLVAHALKELIDAQLAAGAPVVFEYRIMRDADGGAVRDDALQPIVAFGADDHCDPEMLTKVRAQEPVVALMTPLL